MEKSENYIVDRFPHDLDIKRYNTEKIKTVKKLDGHYNNKCSLYFRDIYIFTNNTEKDISNKIQRNALIKFDYNLIIAHEEIAVILEQDLVIIITKFKTIYFKSIGLYSLFP